ncbi:DUF438 domain-containing protein [Allisonella histaminiformans]|uniref:DUF438 domain-containing protein n=1 Tax=Allisonella histaminiformans TaxID=209880 RepID=UPI00388EFC52
MDKIVDLNKTVYDLVQEFPEVKDVLASLGFSKITSPMALKVMGRVMTIPKGAAMMGIPMETIIRAFASRGLTVKDAPPATESEQQAEIQSHAEKIKQLLKRLGAGEDFESVRKDFVTDFGQVSAHDIMKAEQSLIAEGEDPARIRKLCDLHSTLFHGRTEMEILSEEKRKQKAGLSQIPSGHPVDYFFHENTALTKELDLLSVLLFKGDKVRIIESLKTLKKVRVLYSKKEELLMTVLVRYGVTGPSEVMWGVDDEIRMDLSRILHRLTREEVSALKETIKAVITRMKEMIYKEEHILFPLCLSHFTDEEWVDVYRDLHEMGPAFIQEIPSWPHGDEVLSRRKASQNGTEAIQDGTLSFSGDGVNSPAGTLTMAQMKSILSLLPLDITVIDEQEINRFYKNTDRVFSRPLSTLNRPTYDCHPPYIKPMVERMIRQFKEGSSDKQVRTFPKDGKMVTVTYAAMRDENGSYLGTVEFIQESEQK